MTPQRAKELLEVFTAFANGETIQCKVGGRLEWLDCSGPSWNEDGVYRIKPKPRLRPWKPEEAPKAFVVTGKDNPGKEVRAIYNGHWADSANEYNEVGWALLLKWWVRIDEHGNEHPCGVICGEGE